MMLTDAPALSASPFVNKEKFYEFIRVGYDIMHSAAPELTKLTDSTWLEDNMTCNQDER